MGPSWKELIQNKEDATKALAEIGEHIAKVGRGITSLEARPDLTDDEREAVTAMREAQAHAEENFARRTQEMELAEQLLSLVKQSGVIEAEEKEAAGGNTH